MHRSYVVALMARALANGGQRRSLTLVHWDLGGECEAPVSIELEGRVDPHKRTGDGDIIQADNGQFYWPENAPTLWPVSLVMEVKCRRCVACLKARSFHWRMRATQELAAAQRSWFGTLTYNPVEVSRVTMQVEHDLNRGGTRLAQLDDQEQFREYVRVMSKDVTLWLKRIRKASGAKLRYLLVAEAHKSGIPHFHVLVHEKDGSLPVRERLMRHQWTHGFSKWNLVEDSRAAAYVCKYLAKSMNARTRASIDYGREANESRMATAKRVAPAGRCLPKNSTVL